MLPAFGEVSTLSSQTSRCNKGGRGRCKDDIKRSSVFFLFNFNLFKSIEVSISCTQASNLLLSLQLPFNFCTSSEEIYFLDVFSLFLPNSHSNCFGSSKNKNVSFVYGGNPRPTHLRHRICLKFFHWHHRNYLYNPHIQSHYPESCSQGLASNLEVTLMTETEFLLPQRR